MSSAILSSMARTPSHQTKLILQALIDSPNKESYGLQVVRASGVGSGSAYAILRRLEDEGCLDGRWEKTDASDQGRPLRRYYRLTDDGRRIAQEATARDRDALRLLAPGWAWLTSMIARHVARPASPLAH
jgi:PadR family transcriptional regulator, regulatory protein PadR